MEKERARPAQLHAEVTARQKRVLGGGGSGRHSEHPNRPQTR